MEQSCLWRYLRSGSVACFSKSQAGRVASELLRFWPNFQAQTLATELLIKKMRTLRIDLYLEDI